MPGAALAGIVVAAFVAAGIPRPRGAEVGRRRGYPLFVVLARAGFGLGMAASGISSARKKTLGGRASSSLSVFHERDVP